MKITELPRPGFINEVAGQTKPVAHNATEKDSFKHVLENTVAQKPSAIKFSAHAVERLASRNISLTTSDVTTIQNAVGQLEQKGGKESLVMMGNLAFLVSVKNNTVITALDRHQKVGSNIFTKIDSAIIM